MSPDELESGHSVTVLIGQLKSRDAAAAEQLWQRYFERLLPLARAKLKGSSAKHVDEEDILVSVFDRLFTAAGSEKFARLSDRDDLWQILLMLTERKIIDQHRRDRAGKRGGGEVFRETDLSADLGEIRELVDRSPDPQWLVAFNENLRQSITRLLDPRTRAVALSKLEGKTNQEISDQLDISIRSVERKLRVIREVWQEEFGEDV